MGPWRGTAATNWLKERDCFVQPGEKYTHLLLDGFEGGRAVVDHEDLPAFYKLIASDAKAGRPNFIVEQKSFPLFPFFLDLDCEDDVDLTDEILDKWIPLIHAAVKETVTEREDTDFMMVICSAPTKRKPDGKIKTGFHLHWPGVPINKARALQLRGYILCKLHEAFGDRTGNSWNAVVDPSVMMDNGLRMLFSFKCVRCTVCPEKLRKLEKEIEGGCKGGSSTGACPCVFCDGKRKIRRECGCTYGKIHEKRPYTYLRELDGDGNVAEESGQRTALEQLFLTSVRTYDEVIKEPVELVPPPYYDAKLVELPGARKGRDRVPQVRTSHASPHNGNALPRDGRLYAAVKEALRGIPISNVFKEGEGQSSVYWVWSRSHVCKNVDRAHANNNVWFEITRNGVFQRCFDDECRGFRSEPSPIPYEVSVRLFSTTTPESGAKRESAMTTAALRLAYLVSYDPTKAATGKRARSRKGARDE